MTQQTARNAHMNLSALVGESIFIIGPPFISKRDVRGMNHMTQAEFATLRDTKCAVSDQHLWLRHIYPGFNVSSLQRLGTFFLNIRPAIYLQEESETLHRSPHSPDESIAGRGNWLFGSAFRRLKTERPHFLRLGCLKVCFTCLTKDSM